MKIGLLTEEEVREKELSLGSYIRNMGPEIFQLPNGGICNRKGWELFNKEMEKNIIADAINQGWRIYDGKIIKQIPANMQLMKLPQFPTLNFIKNK